MKSARPTLDFEPRYGATSGPWTTAMFVDAVYQGRNDDERTSTVRMDGTVLRCSA